MKPVLVVAIAIGVGALSFFGGMQYQKSQLPVSRSFITEQQGANRVGQTGQSGISRRKGNGQPVSGEIISLDETTLTVKLSDGSSRIILISDKTIFNKTVTLDKSEVKKGDKVGVFGTSNTDGSVTAQNVQLNPQFRIPR